MAVQMACSSPAPPVEEAIELPGEANAGEHSAVKRERHQEERMVVTEPIVFGEAALTALLSVAEQPAAVVVHGTGDEERVSWWMRGQSVAPVEVQGAAGLALTMHADGRLLGVSENSLQIWMPGQGTAAKDIALEGQRPTRIALSMSGDWLLVEGATLEVRSLDGERLWTFEEDGFQAAGWMGDRLRIAVQGRVVEIKPRTWQSTDVGRLPQVEGEGVWRVGIQGDWIWQTAKEITIYPAAQVTTDATLFPMRIVLQEGVERIGWLDGKRIWVSTAKGMYLYESGKPAPIGGNVLAEESGELVHWLHP